MVIVKIMAGLGNQMFEYALFRALLVSGKDAKMDISFFDRFHAHNGYELSKVFNIKEIYATRDEASELGGIKLDPISRIFRKFIYRKKTHYIQDMGEGFGYLPEVFLMDNVYLQGYWQSEKYFKDIEEVIRKEFTFKNGLDERNKNLVRSIDVSNSVSLHVRRGDYVKSPNLGGICTRQYYENAAAFISDRLDNPHFYIFSDDIEWCKSNIHVSQCTYVDINKGEKSYIDMQLMSLCKHNIIANSSFSWWGAWLNNNKNKIVITPMKWNNAERLNTKDLIPDNWIKLNI